MKLVPLNRCLNTALKFYGLSSFGVIVGGLAMSLVWLMLSMPFGIITSMPGYGAGHAFGMMWHKGIVQRIIYWHLPISRLLGGKSFPPSYNRKYI